MKQKTRVGNELCSPSTYCPDYACLWSSPELWRARESVPNSGFLTEYQSYSRDTFVSMATGFMDKLAIKQKNINPA